MKKLLTVWIALALALFVSGVSAEASQFATAKFAVEKMTCATCPIAVSKAMKRVDGVKDVDVDFDSKTAVVTYDSSVANTDAIGKASTDVGFPATLKTEES